MATISSGGEFIVFKFAESGLVALCQEVADLVASGGAERLRLDLSSAEYRRDETGQHNVVFAYAKEGYPPDVTYRGYTFVSNDIALYVWHGGEYVDTLYAGGASEGAHGRRVEAAKVLVDGYLDGGS